MTGPRSEGNRNSIAGHRFAVSQRTLVPGHCELGPSVGIQENMHVSNHFQYCFSSQTLYFLIMVFSLKLGSLGASGVGFIGLVLYKHVLD